jgi:hypothetical protein
MLPSVSHIAMDVTNSSSSSQYIYPDISILWSLVIDIECSNFLLFSFDELHVRSVLSDHGLIHDGLSFHLCFDLLCHHLLSGLCAQSATPACCAIAGSASSPQLCWEISQKLLANYRDGGIPLAVMRQLCFGLGYIKPRAQVHSEDAFFAEVLTSRAARMESFEWSVIPVLLSELVKMKKPQLLEIAALHGLACCGKIEAVCTLVINHLCKGACSSETSDGCEHIQAEVRSNSNDSSNVQVQILQAAMKSLHKKALMTVLHAQGIHFTSSMTLAQLRRLLKLHIRMLSTGKETVIDDEHLKQLRSQWPQPVGQRLKDTLGQLFQKETCSDTLCIKTCACCAESIPQASVNLRSLTEINLNLFTKPGSYSEDDICTSSDDDSDMDSCGNDFEAPYPFVDGPLKNLLVDPGGVHHDDAGEISLFLCQPCLSYLDEDKVPRLALANNLFLGPVPPELKGLTAIEESMISLCRSKCWIMQLKEDKSDPDVVLPHAQKGMRGHVIIYPQKPESVAKLLPPSIEDIVTPVCVLFIGSKPPTAAWLKDKAKPLLARGDRVRKALLWLKHHNPLYKDIVINETVLRKIPSNNLLPFHIEHVHPNEAQEDLQSWYDTHPAVRQAFASFGEQDNIPFENVVVTDVEGHASSNELCAAAVRHVKKKGGGYIEVGHAENPVNEFGNPDLFPMIYPSLFPYGVGGCEDQSRVHHISLQSHVKHLFSLSDRRFQEHPCFMFTAFNILQRRAVLLHTSLKVKRSSFASVAEMFAAISSDAVHRVVERVANGDYVTAKDEDEKKVLKLMKEVNVVSSHVPGSSASKILMRNEMRGLMMHLGLPSFFITINPADIYNPIVKFLAGNDIDIDNMPPFAVPQFREQAFLIANNPTITAKLICI